MKNSSLPSTRVRNPRTASALPGKSMVSTKRSLPSGLEGRGGRGKSAPSKAK